MYPSNTRRKKTGHETFQKTECPQVQAFHFPKCESKGSLRALLHEGGLEINNALEKFQRRSFTGNEITDGVGGKKKSKLNK